MFRVPLITTAVIAAVLLLYSLLGMTAAHRKLADLEPIDARGDYRITLAFAPERFHQVLLQEQGRLVEVRADTVYMKDMTPQALRSVARNYWVTAVDRWDGK